MNRVNKDHPRPTIENWAWLGRELVIPVGQAWPWLTADQVYLRRPLVEPGEKPLMVKKETGLLGLKRNYILQPGQRRIRIHYTGPGAKVLFVEGGASPQIEMHRALPLPLLVMVAMRIADEIAPTTAPVERKE